MDTTYDPRRYIAVDEHGFDSETVRCRVTWTWRTGGTATVEGDYLSAEGGYPVLRCGIYDLGADLDMPVDWFTDAKCVEVSDLVDRQLARQAWAVLVCPAGRARIELVPHGL